MQRLTIATALLAAACASATGETGGPRHIPRDQILDARHFTRHSSDEVEVIVVRTRLNVGFLTVWLDGKAIAKIAEGQAMRLFLLPGQHRFGVVPSVRWGRANYREMKAEITRESRQVYAIFQTAGFTSLGGSPIYEIERIATDRRDYRWGGGRP